jgi:hypothetical protein
MPALSAMHLLIHFTSSVVTANAALVASSEPAATRTAIPIFMSEAPSTMRYEIVSTSFASTRTFRRKGRAEAPVKYIARFEQRESTAISTT